MTEAPGRADLFLSYIRQDQAWAEWVVRILQPSGATLIRQWWDFSPRQDWAVLAREVTERAENVVVLVSPALANSPYAAGRWPGALGHQLPPDRPLTAIVVEDVPLPAALRFARVVDLTAAGRREELARSLILDAIVPHARLSPEEALESPAPRFPGRPAPIMKLPPRNPRFTGRVAEMDALHERVTAGRDRTVVTPAQAIHGLGGIGKTQLLIEYAYRYAVEYDIIWWISAEQSEAIAASVTGLATRMGVTLHDLSDDTVTAVWNVLAGRDRWLLIFDNADSPRQLAKFLPPHSGHVLISSRNPNWGAVGTTVELPVWAESEAEAFLAKAIGDPGEQEGGKQSDLAKRLGYLPLALDQAAAYIEEAGTDTAEYLEILTGADGDELMARGVSAFHEDNMRRTLELSTEEVLDSPEATALFSLSSFLYPDDVPRDLLAQTAGALPRELRHGLHRRLAFDDAVRLLSRLSLASPSPHSMRVHRLVQAHARTRLPAEQRAAWLNALARWLGEVAPADDLSRESRERANRLVPHVRTLVGHVRDVLADGTAAADLDIPRFVRLLDVTGVYLHRVGQLDDAFGALHRALVLVRDVGGVRSAPLVRARLLSKIGGVLHDQGAEDADERFEEALRLADEHRLEPHKVATIRSRFGRCLQEAGKLADAKAQLDRALADAPGGYQPDAPVMAAIHGNLGRTLQDLGKMPAAQVQYEQALAIMRQCFGDDSFRVPSRENDLAGVMQYRGMFRAAHRHLESALRTTVVAYGGRLIPQALPIFMNLGAVRHDLGDHQGAAAALDDARKVVDALDLVADRTVAILLTNDGALRFTQGDLTGGRDRHERALDVLRRAGGRTATWLVVVRNNLGPALIELGDLGAAYGVLAEALAFCEQTYGPRHPRTAAVRCSYANLLLRRGDLPAALDHHQQAIDDTEGTWGSGHHRLAVYRNNVALARHGLGDERARHELAGAAGIAEEVFGAAHPTARAIARNRELIARGEPPDRRLYVTLRIHQRLRAVDG